MHLLHKKILTEYRLRFEIYAAAKIAKYAGAKLVYEVRDLWPLTPIELGHYSKYNPAIQLMNRAEHFAYKRSDFVISVLPCVHEYMRAHGLNLNKLIIIPNGVFKDDWFDNNIEPITDKHLLSVLQKERANGRLIVGFTGALNQANALEYLLDAAYILKDKEICFILVGNGADKQYLQAYAAAKGLRNVFFFNYISKKQIPDLLQHFDIAYIGWRKLGIYRFGISPNKLMDYMMAGKLIISAIKAGNDPVMEVGCGITVEAENPQAIADGILKLASLPQEERQAMGKRGRDYILKNQTYDILAKRFLDFVTGTKNSD